MQVQLQKTVVLLLVFLAQLVSESQNLAVHVVILVRTVNIKMILTKQEIQHVKIVKQDIFKEIQISMLPFK